ncbi:MAG: LacI family DNA-binding transcriptional regulator [Woeseiaceae bacterium]|nr:LacI family DNA-binding transcriptional regulator [Woeseiaceae bacterium]
MLNTYGIHRAVAYNAVMKVENPTSRDIADIAGVSQATVSRALRNSPLVRPETRDRIQKIARELNYFVNRNAAGLRTHQSNTIALLMFDETGGDDAQINPFFLSMLGYITRSAAGMGYDVLASMQQLTDDWHVEYQASHRADGLILLGYGDYVAYRRKLDALAAANTRFIIYGAVAADQPGLSLGCDNVRGGHMATAHLLGLGRRRIAILGDISKRHPEFAARHDGYVAALDDAGLEHDESLRIFADNTEEDAYRAVRAFLDSGTGFDGLFAVTDMLAIGAMHALADAGRQVPQDVSVVGFDDLPRAAYVNPPLTTIQQNIREAGEGLVKTIVGLIEGEDVASSQLEPKLIVRQSCGAL